MTKVHGRLGDGRRLSREYRQRHTFRGLGVKARLAFFLQTNPPTRARKGAEPLTDNTSRKRRPKPLVMAKLCCRLICQYRVDHPSGNSSRSMRLPKHLHHLFRVVIWTCAPPSSSPPAHAAVPLPISTMTPKGNGLGWDSPPRFLVEVRRRRQVNFSCAVI